MQWPDQKQYIGQFVEDKRQGEGRFVWPDGREYTGGWQDGKQHGEGCYTNSG